MCMSPLFPGEHLQNMITLTPSKPDVKDEGLYDRYADVLRVLKEAFGDRLKTVVLFGSQARDEGRPGSDHDLYLVIEDLAEKPLARLREVRMPLLPILHRLPGAIGFIAKTPEEFEENLTPLLLDVCADGICLYGEDYFEPFRRRALAAIEEAGLQRTRSGNSWKWTFPKISDRNWELTWDGYREFS